jgi:hypothetical protein
MVRSRFALLICAAMVTAACTARPPATADETSALDSEPPSMNAVSPPAAAARSEKVPPPAARPAGARGGEPSATAVHAPEVREITIPADTALSLELETTVSSENSSIEDPVQATLQRAIVVNGETVVPVGAQVSGHVTETIRPGRIKGLARVGIRFNRLRVGNTAYDIRTAAISRQGEATKKDDATKIGIGGGAGAIPGAIAGGKKGAAIGTAVGAGGGTAVVLATRGEDVTLARGTVITARLAQPVTIRIH